MTTNEFFLKWHKKYNDFDGVYGTQCVDVIKQYFQDVLGLQPFKGNAIDYWTKDIPGFTKIKKSLFVYPKPGDIIIWNIQFNQFGHIGICNWVRIFDFNCFEQNFPTGSPCHYQTHSYKSVLGWLRPDPIPLFHTPSQPIIYKIAYLSDTDDLAASVSYCNTKLREFSNNLISLEYFFVPIPPVQAPVGSDLDQFKAMSIIDTTLIPNPCHGLVLGYYSQNASQGYSTFTTSIKKELMSSGYKHWPQEILLFELGHQLITYYNLHRGSRPFIKNIDNYKSADGGLSIVKDKVTKLLPYLDVFNL